MHTQPPRGLRRVESIAGRRQTKNLISQTGVKKNAPGYLHHIIDCGGSRKGGGCYSPSQDEGLLDTKNYL